MTIEIKLPKLTKEQVKNLEAIKHMDRELLRAMLLPKIITTSSVVWTTYRQAQGTLRSSFGRRVTK